MVIVVFTEGHYRGEFIADLTERAPSGSSAPTPLEVPQSTIERATYGRKWMAR